ncbi:adenosylmethionine--8-amino-7-oxononanoate transaminase [Aquirhabdus sp.]|uniref:adenosylmethionine--8-amino-7-oxononanoate transaminase n=1 Tax=Aquirhabdus sp. TaxID=2824160 RepID=UPI00396C80FB
MNIFNSTSPLWHPCTQMQSHETMPPIQVVRGQGVYLYKADGTPILDAISSWWVNLHGHSHPVINAAIIDQLGQLEQVMLAGFTHPPIEQLAQRLVEITRPELTHCFFADSGSAAVEVALKMSLQYWHQSGQPQRKTFISLANGYHGETLGSLAVTDIPLFSSQYQPLLIKHLRAPSPDLTLKEIGENDDVFLKRQFAALEKILVEHAEQVCAIIVEPLIQGAAGMKMYPPIYLTWLRRLCDQFQVHLILDEIAVGFGRTGTMFAHEQADISPDFLCLSKGLTAGYLPMSCVMTTEDVYQAFYSPQVARGFLHSHSFTGNPLAARAALASLDLFRTEQVLERNQLLIAAMQKALEKLKSHPHIGHIRQTGMVGAFTLLQANGQPYPTHESRGQLIAQFAMNKGVLLRPIGHHIYLIPPYCISVDEIEHIIDVARQAVEWAVMQSLSTPPSPTGNISLP